ncbi:MAG TPA: hypothetical protein QF499_10425 [Gammaproteobacteria bacterium]|jgi:hypothetical protein|nr:hypothetical protein [Gammaproteobacteria bacterium]
MWKSSVRGIILNQTNFSLANVPDADIEQDYHNVFSALDELAWFHRIPVLILATATTIFCVARHQKKLDKLDQVKREQFISGASKLPFWGLFNKLISSIALLHYFDNHPY